MKSHGAMPKNSSLIQLPMHSLPIAPVDPANQPPKPPRGIQLVKRKLADGGYNYRYRVQFKKNNNKIDKLFETQREAEEFLHIQNSLVRREKEREELYANADMLPEFHEEGLTKETNRTLALEVKKAVTTNSFESYANLYMKMYIETKYDDITIETAKTPKNKMRIRNYKNTKSFYKTICNTVIAHREDMNAGFNDLSPAFEPPKMVKFGSIVPFKITRHDINAYVRVRAQKGIKASSIEREITHISNVFNKLKDIDYRFEKMENPALQVDKDILTTIKRKNIKTTENSKKKTSRITPKEKEKLLKILAGYENEEMGQIVLLMLYTSMRRTEVVLLEWSQISGNQCTLHDTKNGKSRVVYLIDDALEVLEKVKQNKPNKKRTGDRLFSYSVLGFQGSFDKLMENNDLKHITCHVFRKDSISEFIEDVGANNSMMIARILGIRNVKKFKEKVENNFYGNPVSAPKTQEDIAKMVGHSDINVTAEHYFSLRKPE